MINYIICFYNGNLIQVPYDDEMSGYYPKYKEAKILTADVGDGSHNFGILVTDNSEYQLVEDSWDGFQPVYHLNIKQYVDIMKSITDLIVM